MAEVDLTAFMQASNNLERVTRDLRDQNQSTGKEIAGIIGNDLKKVTDPFVSAFQQIPGLTTLGSVGKTLFNKAFTLRKEKKEQEALRKRLRLTKEEFETLKEQKKIKDAQKEELEQLKLAADNLLGFDVENFNIGARMFVDEQGRFSGGIQKLIDGQQDMIESDLAKTRNQERNASAAEEIENENERREQQRDSIFQKISSTLSGIGTTASGPEEKGGIFSAIGGALSSVLTSLGAFSILGVNPRELIRQLLGPIRRAFAGIALGVSMNFELFKDTVKQKLTPFFDKLRSFGNFLKTKLAPVGEFLKKIMVALGGKLMKGVRLLTSLAGAFRVTMLTAVIPGMIAALGGILTSMGAALVPLLPAIGIGLAIAAAVGLIGFGLTKLRDALGFSSVFDLVLVAAAGMKDAFGHLNNFIAKIVNFIGGLIEKGGKFLGFDFELPKIEIMATDNAAKKVVELREKAKIKAAEEAAGMTNPMLQVDTNQINENLDLASASSQPIIINNVDNSVVSGGGGGGFIPLPFPILDPNPPVGTLAAV